MKYALVACLIVLSACAKRSESDLSTWPAKPSKTPVTEFRKLECQFLAVSSQGQTLLNQIRSDEIPEDAFTYTLGMQTFWHTLRASYLDEEKKTAKEVTVTVAMQKIGIKSKISYMYVQLNDLKTNSLEISTKEVEPASEIGKQPNETLFTTNFDSDRKLIIDCNLTPSKAR